ncbi:DUF1405 domain-containing protein [Kurthia massiliensis]|uniref:DUF1405 domain-containing protein n=1 Tax=Kurthia massiliensis TaxID=1033739 RepID=UPI000287A897|nr:DUF1405 domain-containing protein [Kurthia massiliensis]
MQRIQQILFAKWFLILLLLINIGGTIYGYIWYGWQLERTAPIFWIFVPDSPTATLFFCFAIIGWLFNKHFRLFEALALVSNLKYGLWAVAMNGLAIVELDGNVDITAYMLIASHFLMAVQAVLYIPKYDFKPVHIIVTAIIVVHNEIIDYVFGQMPIYSMLNKYMNEIGYFTFWLSIACILCAFYVYKRRLSFAK